MIKNVDCIPIIEDYLNKAAHPLRQAGKRRFLDPTRNNSGFLSVTVITIVRNRKETLPKTITSVSNQSYGFIEYIVIDGASNDGTLEIIKKFGDKINYWISEPDCGTSDAFNKAISLAKGDFIFWLSSDDWIEPDFIAAAVRELSDSGADFVFGDMAMYDRGLVRVYKGDPDYVKSILSGYPHFNFPTMVIKSECFRKIGLIDITYKYFTDYEWVLRLNKNNGRGIYSSALLVHRGVGGVGESLSTQSALEMLRLLRQYRLPKAKALMFYLYFFVRRTMGNFAKPWTRRLNNNVTVTENGRAL